MSKLLTSAFDLSALLFFAAVIIIICIILGG